MKILYFNRTLYPFEGGADISAYTLLENLSKKHDIVAAYIGKEINDFKIKCYLQNFKQKKGVWRNLFYLNKKFYKVLKKIAEDENPDLIISQDYLIPVSVKVAKELNIKSAVFLRNYFHLSIDGFRSYLPEEERFGKSFYWEYKIQFPFYIIMKKRFQNALENADLICSVSKYMQDVTFKYCNIKSEVIRPFVSCDKYKVDVKDDYITFVNPDKHKGVEIFEKVVNLLPEKKFLVVGKDNYKSNNSNVKVFGWVEDMTKIYEKTKVALILSVWPDPCPRVGIETKPSGIPIIVTNRGGAVEEAENCGIIINDIFDIDEWINAIRKFDDKDFYDKMSKNSKFKALEFDCKRQLAKFNLLLNKLF